MAKIYLNGQEFETFHKFSKHFKPSEPSLIISKNILGNLPSLRYLVRSPIHFKHLKHFKVFITSLGLHTPEYGYGYRTRTSSLVFSVPVSVSVHEFKAISCPYSICTLATKNIPEPVPVHDFNFQHFPYPVPKSQFPSVPVPVLRTPNLYPYLN